MIGPGTHPWGPPVESWRGAEMNTQIGKSQPRKVIRQGRGEWGNRAVSVEEPLLKSGWLGSKWTSFDRNSVVCFRTVLSMVWDRNGRR